MVLVSWDSSGWISRSWRFAGILLFTMPALVNAVHNKADITLVVLDNSGTAMTGFQPHPGVFSVSVEPPGAERIGFVNRVVPHDKLEEAVNEIAEAIVSKSPIIIKYLKKAITRGLYTDLAAGLAFEKTQWALCFATEDHNEGIDAFLNKRKPEFKGR